MRKAITLIIITLVLVGVLPVTPAVYAFPSNGSNTSNFDIAIVNRANKTLYDYQVGFELDLRGLLKNNSTRADLGDLRFYDGDTELPYYIESYAKLRLVYTSDADDAPNKPEGTTFAIVNGTVYGAFFWTSNNRIFWKYHISSDEFEVVYTESATGSYTLWGSKYDPYDNVIWATGAFHDGTALRLELYKWNLTSDTVERAYDVATDRYHEGMTVEVNETHVFIGTLNGKLYIVPKSTWSDTNTWVVAWQHPRGSSDYYGIMDLQFFKGYLYMTISKWVAADIFSPPAPLEVWRYDPSTSTVELVLNLTDVIPPDYALGHPQLGADENYLYIPYVNKTTMTIHVAIHDGSTTTFIDTGIRAKVASGCFPFYIGDREALLLYSHHGGSIWVYFPDYGNYITILRLSEYWEGAKELTGSTAKYYRVELRPEAVDSENLRFAFVIMHWYHGYAYLAEYGKVKVWVKVPSIPANSYKVIKAYYGNQTLTSESNPYAVFDLYDGFEDGVINTTKWYTAYYVEENNGVFATQTDTGIDILELPNYLSINGTGEVETVTEDGVTSGWLGKSLVTSNTIDLSQSFVVEATVLVNDFYIGGSTGNYGYKLGIELAADKDNRFDWALSASGDSVERGLYTLEELAGSVTRGTALSFDVALPSQFLLSVKWYGDGKALFEANVDENRYVVGNTTTLSGVARLGFFADVRAIGDKIVVWCDWIRVRKLVEPEPIVIPFWSPGLKGEYRIPITVEEQSGNTLVDYAVRLELNGTNFPYWGHFASYNGSDIYFMDEQEKPLYHWIEKFDLANKEAVVWVKIPELLAGSSITIYMYYGWGNPYPSYYNATEVFSWFLDEKSFRDADNVTGAWSITLLEDSIMFEKSTSLPSGFEQWTYYVNVSTPFEVVIKVLSSTSQDVIHVGMFEVRGSPDIIQFFLGRNDKPTYFPDGFGFRYVYDTGGDGWDSGGGLGDAQLYKWYYVKGKVFSDRVELCGLQSTSLSLSIGNNPTTKIAVESRDPLSYVLWDFAFVRKFVDPEPSISLGYEELLRAVYLPSESVYLVHEIVYSPNSTQFSHSFTAINTAVAGYEINYTDAYGWRVYALPYDSTENMASLVSEVNVTLPYTEVIVKNITLLARTNGTGSFRQLWIRVLNSTGGVVAELTNASIGSGWAEVSLVVNTSLSGQITLWINATMKSTASVGEEIAVRDVRIYVEYDTNPKVMVPWRIGLDFFNCSASHYVELDSSEYLNSSVITFKLIQYLTLNATDYPVQPVYVGNETIGSHSYSVYRIEPADYSQYLTIYALLENKLRTFRTHVRGYDTAEALVGEPVTIELPVLGNITIVELNKTFINVTTVTIRFAELGAYTIEANTTLIDTWELGYGRKSVVVRYGSFSARLVDVSAKTVDYEDVVLQLINKTDGNIIKVLTGNKLFSLDNLWAGNYTVLVKFKDITVGARDFELNTTTDASTIDLQCTMKSLSSDYRGFNRTVIYEYGKQLASIENMSSKYPYSRMKVLLNGTGSFKLYINYRGDLPTKVVVEGNITGLKSYWDGNYLVIEGNLGSIGELNIADLYKVRLELYDRLGNLMPSWIYIYINETKYSGSVVEDYLYPEDYVIKLPATVSGFEFYGFFDGFNESVRAVSINNSDITLKAWYRIPTSIELKSYQVSGASIIPFIRQEGETVKVYVEGCLKDYYGNGVPSRPLAINVTNIETGYTKSYNATADVAGYFRSPVMELFRGKTYRIEVTYSGDDIYVGAIEVAEVKPEELPVAPVAFEMPVNYLLAAVGIALIAIGIFAAVRATGHTVEDLKERSRRFVRKKR